MSTSANNEAAVTVVHSDGCHYCDDARSVLTEIAADFPLRVEYLDAASDEGSNLVALHRAPMFPLILIDGRFFSHGRLPRRKLLALLRDRAKAGMR